MASFDARTAEIHVFTFRAGLLAAAGHDLELAATEFSVDVDGAEGPVRARVAAASLRLVSHASDGDRRQIERNAADDVLDARRFASIEFAGTRIVRDGNQARVEGTLTLHGATRPLAFTARDDGEKWRAEITLDQRDFGIKPFSALFGTLRVRPDVRVRVSVPSR